MKNRETRKEEAQVRQEEHSKLTSAQKITKLDLRFGKDQGAKRERARLAVQYQKDKQEAGKEIVELAKKLEKKPYQKPKKS